MEQKPLPELLAPAGSKEAAIAAVRAGADAVYLGGTMLNARMNAKNFGDDEMREIIAFCHRHGVRVYVTLNISVYDRELNGALRYVDFLYVSGVDALIVADLGLASLIATFFPDLPLHASTQASGHSVACAQRLKQLGFCRMVCARELNKEETDRLCKQSPIETEQFIHGALCVSQSGQCLASAMIGGRSGNRGECAQPCRMQYNGKYPLSLKDSALAKHIPQLIQSGVTSLKIEGRMKSPAYVFGVVSIYRRLLDGRRAATDDEMNRLAELFSRGGFTDGYYTSRMDGEMNGVRSASDKLATAKATSMQSEAYGNWHKLTEKIDLSRTEITVPARMSNPQASYAPKKLNGSSKKSKRPVFTARFASPGQIVADGALSIIYLPLDKFQRGCGANGVVLPPTLFDRDIERAERLMEEARENGAEHALVCNIGHIDLARRHGFILHGDYRLNIFNSVAAELYINEGMRDVMLAPELTLPQIRDISAPKSAVVYGRIPLMLLTKPLNESSLTDRTGAVFPVMREFGYDLLLNSVPFYMADKQKELDEYGVRGRHLIFTVESRRECAEIIRSYTDGQATALPRTPVRRIKK
ncbi:MAG: U32 family peptidase [Clostridia bacterium]|nr:U32 family peptidase [Clostridia bacterium]